MPSIHGLGSFRLWLALLVSGALLLSACSPAASGQVVASAVPVTGANNSAPANTQPQAQSQAGGNTESVTPAVKIADQPIVNGTVTIDNVSSPGPGWIVIHINSNGAPGEIIGWTPVKAGVNPKVVVTVDASKATPVLYAMLHVDAGTIGTYEFPGPDKPLVVNGQMVSPPFAVTGGGGNAGAGAAGNQPAANAAQPTATQAAAASGQQASGALPGVKLPGEVTTNVPQVGQVATNAATGANSYGNQAAATAAPSTGSGAASGGAAASGTSTVSISNNAKLGNILVDSRGMTLYIFKKDTPGKSNCTGGCLENWPPLLVSSGSPTAGANVSGKLGQITRPDNGTQVTYNDMPLYYFAGDQAAGDVNGQGIGSVWFAATP